MIGERVFLVVCSVYPKYHNMPYSHELVGTLKLGVVYIWPHIYVNCCMTTFKSQQIWYTINSSIVAENYPVKDTLVSLSEAQMHFKDNKVPGMSNALKVCYFK